MPGRVFHNLTSNKNISYFIVKSDHIRHCLFSRCCRLRSISHSTPLITLTVHHTSWSRT